MVGQEIKIQINAAIDNLHSRMKEEVWNEFKVERYTKPFSLEILLASTDSSIEFPYNYVVTRRDLFKIIYQNPDITFSTFAGFEEVLPFNSTVILIDKNDGVTISTEYFQSNKVVKSTRLNDLDAGNYLMVINEDIFNHVKKFINGIKELKNESLLDNRHRNLNLVLLGIAKEVIDRITKSNKFTQSIRDFFAYRDDCLAGPDTVDITRINNAYMLDLNLYNTKGFNLRDSLKQVSITRAIVSELSGNVLGYEIIENLNYQNTRRIIFLNDPYTILFGGKNHTKEQILRHIFYLKKQLEESVKNEVDRFKSGQKMRQILYKVTGKSKSTNN